MNLEQALELVKKFFKEEPHKYDLWMTTNNPMTGGVSPRWMIDVGREEKLIQFIKESLAK